MSTDPFNRNKTREARLGEIITEAGEQNQRDAVHIAVVPCVASCDLTPGQHVGVTADGKYSMRQGTTVGIVDPFLTSFVPAGQTFWLCLYQGQVTTLRHEWTHPAFPNVEHRPTVDLRAASESWLRLYMKVMKPYDDTDTAYQDFLAELTNDEIYFHGTDSDFRIKDDCEFWGHVANVTGKTHDRENITIRCSC
jgi:hypothetical protein